MRAKTVMLFVVFFIAASAVYSIVAFQVTAVSVSVSEPEYRGFCPHTFTFTGRITANRAGSVRYTWVRSDKLPQKIHTLVFQSKGSKTVKHTWELGGKTMGTFRDRWAMIRILAPNARYSNKAKFDLTCLPQVRMVRKMYKVTGQAMAGGSHVDWLEGLQLRFRLVSGARTICTTTGTFDSIGTCRYSLVAFNAPGSYRVVVEPVHPTNPEKYHLCFRSIDPAYIFVNLTEEAPESINNNFHVNWGWRHLDMNQEAFDGPCW